MKKILPKTLEVMYPFDYWLKKMPAEIQDLINDKSRTQANEFSIYLMRYCLGLGGT